MKIIHTEIINYLIEKYNYKTYLEIGVYKKECFNEINIEHKECCDVKDWLNDNDITYLMTSDEMFDLIPINKKFDIIFIDGLHSEHQLDKDIINSLKHLNKGGIVLCHDILPCNPKSAIEYFDISYNPVWNGTCYKSICKLNNENIEFYTIDNDDHGLTVIKYVDNPYDINIDKYCSNQIYDNLFINNDNNEYPFINNCTLQGKFCLHIISIDDFFNMF